MSGSKTDISCASEPGGNSAEGKRRSLAQTVKEWAEMIKVEHTVFALPFALSGLVLSEPKLPDLKVVFWTVLAFAGARCAAMTLNRVIDAQLDARNPRTSMRAIPAGTINAGQAWVFALVSFAVMVMAASQLPPLCLWLSPIAIFWLSLYSYTKRFTWACHLILGIALGGAALGGWIAAGGQLNQLPPWLLFLSVSCWVAGFDLIYSCQDVAVDKKEGLFSLPSRFGIGPALMVSSVLHVVTVASLLMLGLNLHLGWIYWLGTALVAAMLTWEHSLVKADDLSRVNAAFFNINGCVSIAIFVDILLDKLIR